MHINVNICKLKLRYLNIIHIPINITKYAHVKLTTENEFIVIINLTPNILV